MFVSTTAIVRGEGQAAPASKMPPSIGPTLIRFYSGNLSVGLFRNYWGAKGGEDGVTPERIEQLKRCSCRAMCDYISWCTVEREPDKWDFSFYRRNAEMLNAAGIEYNVFCWLHFPPKWFLESDRFTGYQNLASGKTIPQLSLWSPETLKIYDEFYSRLAKELGPKIAFLRLAMPSEYGEIGYCSGMTKWLVPQEFAEAGYWCADEYAIADFRSKSMSKYGDLAKLNAAWGTTFKTPDDIRIPDPKKTLNSGQDRTRWLDFVDWYQQSWVDFMTRAVTIVRTHFPDKEIILSLGYGGEAAFFGNDQGRFVKAMADLKVAAQTPGAISYFATRRVSSACRAYGVPYFTEPPGGVPRDQQVLRIWMDASNGTQTWFDYLQNLDGARDLFVRYKRHLTGQPPRCSLALWLPTWHQYLHASENWPKLLQETANDLRDLADYEIIDDHMLRDGALQKLGIRVLFSPSADAVSNSALRTIADWVNKGGLFITFSGVPAVVRDGTAQDWSQLVESRPLPSELFTVSVKGKMPAAYSFSVTKPEASPYLVGKWFGIDGTGPGAIHWCGVGGGLRLPVEPGESYRVQLRAGVPAAAGVVQVRCGSTMLREMKPGDGSVIFDLPSALTTNRAYVDLTFAGNAWRPKDVQGSSDVRELLINVGEAKVRQLQPDGEVSTANAGPPPALETQWNYDAIWKQCGKAMGNGRVLSIDRPDCSPAQMAELIAHFSYELARYGPYESAINADGQRDGIWATVFDDHVLYYNSGKQRVSKLVSIGTKPTTIPIEPGEIRSVPTPKAAVAQ